jgi:hypothetical protein
MHIESHDSVVRLSLQRIADAVTANAGEIHPKLTIHHHGERLWITCAADQGSGPLLVVPNELFVPVTQLEWAGIDGKLQFTGSTDSLSPVQKQLLDDMLAIYNQTGKLTQVAERFPAQLLPSDPLLLNWLQEAHSSYKLPKDNPARQFIGTRLNEMPPEKGDDPAVGYLMPLIDYLNHHPFGPKYQRTESGAWRIPLEYPITGSDECFVRYSKTDSLSIAVWHAYYDPHPRHVAALDCELNLSELPPIRIRASFAANRKVNAPRLENTEAGVTLHDVVLEKSQRTTLRTFIGLAVRSKRRELAQPEAETVADELIQLLIEANHRKYTELRELCRIDAEQFPLRPLFGQVAEHQLALLETMRSA